MEHSKIQFKKRTRTKNGKTYFDYYDVFVYYSNNNCSSDEKRELTINTGVKIEDERHITKNKEISTKLPNYNEHYETITTAKARVETIISDYYKKYKQKPTCNYVEEMYHKPIVLEVMKLETITDYYDDFLKWKKDFVKIKEGSMGFYRNNISAFSEYEKIKNRGNKITFVDFENMEFWERFIKFLANEKEDKTRVNQKRFGLSNNTLVKRLKTILEFIKYSINYKSINLPYEKIKDMIAAVKKDNEVKNYTTTKFSLTLDELQQLVWFKPTVYERAKDIFTFMCLQGMRISDTMSFVKTDIIKHNGKFYIHKEAKKTNDMFKVELHPIAKEIFEKWDCDFRDMVKFNEHIKIVMKEFFLWYKHKFEAETGEEYDVTINKHKKNGKVSQNDDVYKWDIISSHYGRGTFISLLSAGNKLSLKEIGERTGQKSVSTTLTYVRSVNTPDAEDLFPIKKEKETKVIKLKKA